MNRRRWAIVLFAVASTSIMGVLMLRDFSRSVVFLGRGRPALAVPEGFRVVRVTSADGVVVQALELSRPGAPVVVHFHDNLQVAAEAAPFARKLHARGVSVVLMEYRGYGVSRAHSPSERGLYDDATALLDHYAGARIGVSGSSLGTAIAARVSARGAALVMVAPFTSVPELSSRVAPWLPAWLVVPDRFETASIASSIRVPTLVVHGDADEIVPFEMGSTLARTIPGARFLPIPGGHHGDMLDRDVVVDAIARLALHGPE
jgi:pimeloyl-ACP methyl ester carboxylesterase